MSKYIDIMGLKALVKEINKDIKTHTHDEYITKNYIDQVKTSLDERIKKLEAKEHVTQPNFTYKINMVASNQAASVVTTGTYPDLIITFNIPQGTGSGGTDTPTDTGTPRMWYGWIPYDENGTAGFNTPEQINSGMTKTIIQYGIDAGGLKETNPQGWVSKQELGTVQDCTFLCCIVPVNSNIVAYYDVAGAKRAFDALPEEAYPYQANGVAITEPIDGVYYKVYGCYLTSGSLQYLWICEE